jgi:Flp pilus assembly pilin Flp
MVLAQIQRFWREEEGQDLVEYSLLLAFIALAAVSILTTVQTNIKNLWTTVNTGLTKANTAAGS